MPGPEPVQPKTPSVAIARAQKKVAPVVSAKQRAAQKGFKVLPGGKPNGKPTPPSAPALSVKLVADRNFNLSDLVLDWI